MWDLIKQIDWSEGFYKGGFFFLAIVVVIAMYQGAKFFGKRFLTIFESMQVNHAKLTDITEKMDVRITLVEKEQKFQNEKLSKQGENIDMLVRTLINATQK